MQELSIFERVCGLLAITLMAVFVYDENGCVRADNTAATRLRKAVEKEEERTIALHRERRRAAALRAM